MNRIALSLAAIATLLVGVKPVTADVIFDFEEAGGVVTFTYAGTLDTTGMTSSTPPRQHAGSFIFDDAAFGGAFGLDLIGIAGTNSNDRSYDWVIGAFDFIDPAPGGEVVFFGTTPGSTPILNLSTGLKPGVSLESADINPLGIWTGSGGGSFGPGTFASIGLTPGTHFYTDATSGESLIFNIGNVAAAPEPSSLLLMVMGVLGGGVSLRRRR